MKEKLEIKLNASLDERCNEVLSKKISSYNLGEEFNYAVVVFNLSITGGDNTINDTVNVKIIPKVRYITPFISKKLAEQYCTELSSLNKIMMLLEVHNGRAIVKNKCIKSKISEI